MLTQRWRRRPWSAPFRAQTPHKRHACATESFCIDVTDNELAYLEAIHLFVEMLDRYFGNVCELDLVFNFHKVCYLGLFAARLKIG